MRSAGVELVLPASLDGAALVTLLADRLELTVDRARGHDRVLLDTFDGRLQEAGVSAERPAGRTASGTLTLREPGAPARSAEVAPAPRHLAAELPAGPLRDRLRSLLGVRALLPLVRVRSRTRPLAVLNSDAKTVVRLELEEAEVVGDGSGGRARAGAAAVGTSGARLRQGVRARDSRADRRARARPRPFIAVRRGADGGRCAVRGRRSKPGVELTRGTTAHQAGALVLARLAEVAAENVPGTLDDLDTEFLHDLRVAVRRARSVLRELRGVFPPAERAHLRDELRWVQALTGPVRDLDVQLLEWYELIGALPPHRVASLDPLHELLSTAAE